MSTHAQPSTDAVVFDVIGTLVDELGTTTREVREALAPAGVGAQRAERLASDWTEGFHAGTLAVVRGERDWVSAPALRREVLEQLLAREDVPVGADAVAGLAAVGSRFDPWPGVPEELSALARVVPVAAVSNGSLAQTARLSARGGLRWHAVLSTELVRTYKPDPAVYQLAVDLLDLQPSRTLFVAAHPWDLRAAASAGFRTAFLPRPHAEEPEPDDRFDLTVASVGELVDACAR